MALLYRYLLISVALRTVISGETEVKSYGRIARSRSQFTYIPKDYAANGLEIALQNETLCGRPYEDYLNPEIFDDWSQGHVHASSLASCIFDHLPEWAKAEFTTVSITLGLIPPTLVAIGPDTSGIALLSLRRPILATALAFGSSAIRSGPDPVEMLKLAPKVKLDLNKHGGLNWRRWPILVAIVVVEYAIAAAAVFNVAYQVSFLTYQAVCWAAIQLFQTRYVPETAAPLFWVLIVVPVTLVCECAIRFRIRKSTYADSSSGTRNRGVIRRLMSWAAELTRSELTPWMYVKAYEFHTEDQKLWWLFFTRFVGLASLAHVLMGSIILSSIFFVNFRNAVIMTTTFLLGALGCRLVMLFELYWMRQLYASESLYPSKHQSDYQTVSEGRAF